jgi:hypothetical protein
MKLKQGFIDDQGTGHIPLTQGKEALCEASSPTIRLDVLLSNVWRRAAAIRS